MALTREQVRHVARLARLRLSPEEEERFASHLSQVVDYAALLAEADTTAVEPTAHASGAGAGAGRPDLALPSLPVEEGLANAPERSGTSLLVPPILE